MVRKKSKTPFSLNIDIRPEDHVPGSLLSVIRGFRVNYSNHNVLNLLNRILNDSGFFQTNPRDFSDRIIANITDFDILSDLLGNINSYLLFNGPKLTRLEVILLDNEPMGYLGYGLIKKDQARTFIIDPEPRLERDAERKIQKLIEAYNIPNRIANTDGTWYYELKTGSTGRVPTNLRPRTRFTEL